MSRLRTIHRGFTLIELLVVIAIIAILAAILFPVFAQAREAARKSACQSNMKQMGTAVQMYNQDFDGVYPIVRYANIPAPFFMTWKQEIYPYTKNIGIFKCPSNAGADGALSNGDCGNNASSLAVPPVSYGWATTNGNAPGSNGFSYGNGASGPNEASLQQTAQQLMIVESTTPCADLCQWCVAGSAGPNNISGHSGTANVLFADGHVKSMKWGQTMLPYNMWTFDGTYNGDGQGPPPGGQSWDAINLNIR